MKFTQIPATTFEELQLNAGILTSSFTPSTMEVENIYGATSGGVTFSDKPTYKDWGEDIDNCPKNTMELKRIESREITLAGSFVTISANTAKDLISSADISTTDTTRIVPRDELKTSDFKDFWWVGDYSNKNGTKNGGFIALHLMHTINSDGFKMKADDKKKGTFDFNLMAHYSLSTQNIVPYELYIKAGTDEPTT